MVWTPQVGATERFVSLAGKLIADPRVVHYWDPGMVVGNAFQEQLGTSESAWDVWMLFGPDAYWGDRPPEPAWWEHQLGELPEDRHLDFERFARKARDL